MAIIKIHTDLLKAQHGKGTEINFLTTLFSLKSGSINYKRIFRLNLFNFCGLLFSFSFYRIECECLLFLTQIKTLPHNRKWTMATDLKELKNDLIFAVTNLNY